MKKREFGAGVLLLSAVGAICLKGLRAIDAKLAREEAKKRGDTRTSDVSATRK